MPDEMLEAAFAELRDPEVETSGPQIRARVRRRRRRVAWLAAAAVAAVSATAVVGMLATREPDDPLGEGRWRGGTADPPVLELGCVVEGAEPREGTVAVQGSEQVVFTVLTDRPGYLCLDEEVDGAWGQVFPPAGDEWWAEAGRHWPGGDSPMAFVTGEGPGRRAYRVRLDPENGDCSSPLTTDVLEVDWR